MLVASTHAEIFEPTHSVTWKKGIGGTFISRLRLVYC